MTHAAFGPFAAGLHAPAPNFVQFTRVMRPAAQKDSASPSHVAGPLSHATSAPT